MVAWARFGEHQQKLRMTHDETNNKPGSKLKHRGDPTRYGTNTIATYREKGIMIIMKNHEKSTWLDLEDLDSMVKEEQNISTSYTSCFSNQTQSDGKLKSNVMGSWCQWHVKSFLNIDVAECGFFLHVSPFTISYPRLGALLAAVETTGVPNSSTDHVSAYFLSNWPFGPTSSVVPGTGSLFQSVSPFSARLRRSASHLSWVENQESCQVGAICCRIMELYGIHVVQ